MLLFANNTERLRFLKFMLSIEGRFLKQDIIKQFPEMPQHEIELCLTDMCNSGLIGKTDTYYFSL